MGLNSAWVYIASDDAFQLRPEVGWHWRSCQLARATRSFARYAVAAMMAALVCGLIGIAVFAFWIWMLVHAITNKGLGDGEKIAWVLVVILLPFVGSLIYFFVGKSRGGTSAV